MVGGARTAPGAHDSWLRRLPRTFLRRYAEWVTRYRIDDINSGLRVFRKDLAERFLKRIFRDVRVCVTGQHRGLLDGVLATFGVTPDYDLDIMTAGQSLADVTARVLSRLDPILASERPDLVYVQGDTTSTLAGALGAFYRRIPVAHVEAGLRTGDPASPFPEEMNRVLTGRMIVGVQPPLSVLPSMALAGEPPDSVEDAEATQPTPLSVPAVALACEELVLSPAGFIADTT